MDLETGETRGEVIEGFEVVKEGILGLFIGYVVFLLGINLA